MTFLSTAYARVLRLNPRAQRVVSRSAQIFFAVVAVTLPAFFEPTALFAIESAHDESGRSEPAGTGRTIERQHIATKPSKSLEFQPEPIVKSLKAIDFSKLPQLNLQQPRENLAMLSPIREGAKAFLAWRSGEIGIMTDSHGARLLLTFKTPIDKASVDPTSGTVAVVHVDTVYLVHLFSGRELHRRNFKSRIQDLVFAPDGRALLLAGADGRVYRWQFHLEGASTRKERGRVVERYIGSASAISALAYHPAGRVFFSGDWKGTLVAWQEYAADAYGGEYDEDLILGELFTAKAVRQTAPGQGRIEQVQLAPQFDGRLWIARQSGTIERWSIRGLSKKAEVRAHSGLIHALAVSPDGSMAVSVGREGIIRVTQPGISTPSLEGRTEESLTVTHQLSVNGARSLAWWGPSSVIVGTLDGMVREVPLAAFGPAETVARGGM